MKYKPVGNEQGCKCSNCGQPWGKHFQDECPGIATSDPFVEVEKRNSIPNLTTDGDIHLSPQQIEALTEKNLTPEPLINTAMVKLKMAAANELLKRGVLEYYTSSETQILKDIEACFASMKQSIETIRQIVKDI